MMKISNRKLTASLERRALGKLLLEVKTLKTSADLNKFFGKTLTKDEREAVLRRVVVVGMLEKGVRYRDIQRALGISRTTISKVRDVLEKRGYGRNPNRKRVYSRVNHKKRREKPLLGYYKGAASII